MNSHQPIPNEPTVIQKGDLPPNCPLPVSSGGDRTGRRVLLASTLMVAGIVGVATAVKMGGLKEANRYLHGEVAGLANTNAELEEKAGFLASLRETLIAKLNLSEEKRHEVEAVASGLAADKQALGTEVARLMGNVDVLNDKVTSGTVKIASLERDGREKAAKIGDLEGVRDRLVVVNFDLKKELDEAKMQVSALSGEKADLEIQLATLDKEFGQLATAVDGLNAHNLVLSEENLDLQREMSDLNYELEVKLAEIDLLRRSIRQAEMDEAVATNVPDSFSQDPLAVPFVLD